MRIVPVINTLSLNLTNPESWTGRGCDAALSGGLYGTTRYMGQISDYGIVSYILELMIIFMFAIRFFSIPTIMFFTGVGG